MAESISESKLYISGYGHVFVAEPGTELPNIDKFKFSDKTTWGTSWTWIGDTSGENVVEIESEGGEIEYKRTWDRKKARSVRSDREITATINSVNLSKETFELAFFGGSYDPKKKSYKVIDKVLEAKKAILIITEDGLDIAGVEFKNTTIAGDFPKFDLENFTEVPLKAAILPDSHGDIAEIFEPRPYNANAVAA